MIEEDSNNDLWPPHTHTVSIYRDTIYTLLFDLKGAQCLWPTRPHANIEWRL